MFEMCKKVYRSKTRTLCIVLVCLQGSYLFIGCIVGILDPGESFLRKLFACLLIAFFLFLAPFSIVSTLTSRVEVSADGIVFFADGFRIYTPWYNIVGFVPIRHPLIAFHTIPALLFRQPALPNLTLEEGKRRGLPVVENYWMMRLLTATPLNYLWYLPLPSGMVSQFDWEQGEISAYLRHYAPHLVAR